MSIKIKPLTLLLILLFLLGSCSKRTTRYNISGQIKGLGNDLVYLTNKELGTNDAFKVIVHDSVFSKNGSFKFNKRYKPTDFFSIEVPSRNSSWLPFLIPNRGKQQINITGHIDSLYLSNVTGSQVHLNFIKLKTFIRTEFTNPYMAIVDKQDSIPAWKDSLNIINKRMETFFIKESELVPDNFPILYYTYINFPLLSKDGMKTIYYNLSNIQKDTEYGKILFNRSHSYQVNDLFDFRMLKDMNNRSIDLNMNSEEYMLLDFWASWCIPCIKELPKLKTWFQQSDRSRLKIIGVSLDTKSSTWKKSIEQNEIPWQNVSDLNGGKGELFTMFNFLSIPQKVLIDPDGRILLITSNIQVLKDFLFKSAIIDPGN